VKLTKAVMLASMVFVCTLTHADKDGLCDPKQTEHLLMDSFKSVASIDVKRGAEFQARINAIDGGSKAKGSAGDTFATIVFGDKKVTELQSKRTPLVMNFLIGFGDLKKSGYADCKKAKEMQSLIDELRKLSELQWELIDNKFSVKYPKKSK